jgi:hypothetical protein
LINASASHDWAPRDLIGRGAPVFFAANIFVVFGNELA